MYLRLILMDKQTKRQMDGQRYISDSKTAFAAEHVSSYHNKHPKIVFYSKK